MFQFFRRGFSYQVLVLLAADVAVLAASGAVGLGVLALLRVEPIAPAGTFAAHVLLAAAAFLVGGFLFDLHHPHVSGEGRPLFTALLRSSATAGLILVGVQLIVPRMVFLSGEQIAVLIIFPFAGFAVWRFLWKDSMAHNSFVERVLILGTGEKAKDLAREILLHRIPGFEVTGFIGGDPRDVGLSILNPTVMGTYDELADVIERERIGCVVVAEDDRRKLLPMETLLDHKLRGGLIFEDTAFLELTAGKVPIRGVLPSWFVFSDGFHKKAPVLACKRIAETVLASLFLLVTLPFTAVIALLIKLDSPGPIFFRQERVGQHGRRFKVIKFRSMTDDAEGETGPVWATKDDDRITRIGRWMRRFRIDEIPQMWNVIRGEMALVGPRPERPHFVEILRSEIPYYTKRHIVRPGITGWAQVNYPYGHTIEDGRKKLQYDFYYVKHMSPALDLFILTKTLKTILVDHNDH